MNLKAAYRATSFMFLPTLTFLVIVFCWFFNWGAFVSFVTAQSGWAGFFRILVLGAEVGLWIYFYQKYNEEIKKEEERNRTISDVISAIRSNEELKLTEHSHIGTSDTRSYFSRDSYDLKSIVYRTATPEIFIVKLVK